MFKVKDEDGKRKVAGKIKFQAPRGMVDILPEEHRYFTFIKKVVRHRCRQAGFQRITTPVVESSELFSRGVGEGTDIVSKEMYIFLDRKGRSLTLRPEGTAGAARAYLEHSMYNLPQPVSLYYVEPMFRYERPQAGRYRQHWQFGVEVLGGENDPVIDAQVIQLGWLVISDLNLSDDVEVQINSIGCPKCRVKYHEDLLNYYSGKKRSLCVDCSTRLVKNPLRLLDCKEEDCRILADGAPKPGDYLCEECKTHFEKLQEYLKILGLPFAINSKLVRGLDYYTKTVFEFWSKKSGGSSALFGGGRYDGLVELLGGAPASGIGFGMGLERMIAGMKSRKIGVPHKDKVQVFVAQLGYDAKKKCLPLISEIRDMGIHTMNSLGQSSLKAQLKLADKLGAEWAVIIGDMEVKQDTALLRDMRIGEQQIVPFDQIVKTIENIFPEERRDNYTPGELEWIGEERAPEAE